MHLSYSPQLSEPQNRINNNKKIYKAHTFVWKDCSMHAHTHKHTPITPPHPPTPTHKHTRMQSRMHAHLEMHIQRGKVLATPRPPYPSDIVQSVESDEDVGCQRNGMRQFYTLLGLLQGGLKGTEIVFLHPVNHGGYIRVKHILSEHSKC